MTRGAWRLPASAYHPAQVVFEAVGAGGDHGYIALDDLHVSDGACPEPGESPPHRGTVDQMGGWDILWGHVNSGDGDRPVPALSLAWPEAGGGVSHPSAPSPARYHRVSHSPSFLPASCDFEQDTCGWSSPSDPRLHSMAWGWKSGITLAKYPSPEQDHTLGTRNGRKHPSLPRHPGMARVRKRGWGWMGSAQSIL